ncbi:hypothetical protein SAMN05660895_1219 [Thermoflavifilum thermophilum]|uniref:Uncharacterized protein n=1 Tax=Thermoflavifilum thermophilum TaxID=1393122 RepID=A0A1I7NBQ0_9BACT|nr:hypothetical protein SAMN05660895_1219 [Thermoflavifilum thermophilum]
MHWLRFAVVFSLCLFAIVSCQKNDHTFFQVRLLLSTHSSCLQLKWIGQYRYPFSYSITRLFNC